MQGNILNHISLLFSDMKKGAVSSFTVLCKLMNALNFRQLSELNSQEFNILLGVLTAFWKEHYTNNFSSMTNRLPEVNYIICGVRRH